MKAKNVEIMMTADEVILDECCEKTYNLHVMIDYKWKMRVAALRRFFDCDQEDLIESMLEYFWEENKKEIMKEMFD